MNLTQRLFLLGLLSLAPALAVVVYLQFELRAAREAEARGLVTRQTHQASSEINRLVEGIRTLLVTVASAPAVQLFDNDTCSAFLSRLGQALPHIRGTGILDADGDLQCASRAVQAPLSYADRRYFQQVVASRSFVIGTYTLSRWNNRDAILPFAVPILTDTAELKGVAVASLDVRYLNDEVKKWALEKGSSLTIADSDGVILARTPLPERFVGTQIPAPFMRWVHGDKPDTEEARSQDGTERIISYIPVRSQPLQGLYLSTGISKEAAFAYVERATRISLIIMVLGLMAMLACIWWAGRYFIRKPVDRLLKLAEGWTAEPPVPRSPPADGGEFGEIGKALNRMGEIFVLQREREKEHQERLQILLKELNHRVKNMLAVVQAIVNQGLRASDVDADTRAKIEARLVALAHSHDLLTEENWRGSSLEALVRRTLEPFGLSTDRAHSYQITGDLVQLNPRVTLSIGMALHELATNAVKYGALSSEAGIVVISWTVASTPKGPRLTIRWRERDGPPVSPPLHKGFGSRLIERSLARELEGRVELSFDASGLQCDIEIPLPHESEPAAAAPGGSLAA